MNLDPITLFQQALRELEAAEKAANRLNDQIHAIAIRMTRWPLVTIKGYDGFPERKGGVVGGPNDRTEIFPENWPTADEAARILTTYHAAGVKARQAWDALAPDQRTGFSAPKVLG